MLPGRSNCTLIPRVLDYERRKIIYRLRVRARRSRRLGGHSWVPGDGRPPRAGGSVAAYEAHRFEGTNTCSVRQANPRAYRRLKARPRLPKGGAAHARAAALAAGGTLAADGLPDQSSNDGVPAGEHAIRVERSKRSWTRPSGHGGDRKRSAGIEPAASSVEPRRASACTSTALLLYPRSQPARRTGLHSGVFARNVRVAPPSGAWDGRRTPHRSSGGRARTVQ